MGSLIGVLTSVELLPVTGQLLPVTARAFGAVHPLIDPSGRDRTDRFAAHPIDVSDRLLGMASFEQPEYGLHDVRGQAVALALGHVVGVILNRP